MNISNIFFKKPRHIGFSHSLKCNLQCKQCKIWKFNSNDPLNIEEKKAIIKKISIWNKSCTINLSGGEPFASKDTIPLIRYAIKNGLKVYLNTNGTLINNEVCKRILKYKDKVTISISIDGPNSSVHNYLRGGKNIFSKAIDSIRILNKYGFKKINILTVISSKNQNYLVEICNLASKLKVNKINFQPICLSGFGNNLKNHIEFKKNSLWPKNILAIKKNINILIDLKQTKYKNLINNSIEELQIYIEYFKNPFSKKVKCDFYKNGLSIDYKGNLRVCYVVKNIIGNLLNDDINDLMLSNQRKIILNKMKKCSLPCKILSCHRKKDFKYYLNRFLLF